MKKNTAQNIKKILVICALEAEIKIAKEWIKQNRPENIQVCFFVTWTGCVETTLKLTEKLANENYDFILNYWVCGYKEEYKEVIQIARSIYIPSRKEIIVPYIFDIAPLRSISCSETPVYDAKKIWEENFVDMESYAVEKVCDHFQIPRLILKVPVDKIGEETRNFEREKAKNLLDKHLDFQKIFEKISEYLSKIPEKFCLEKYENHFSFTVSEKIIFEKYYSKYTTLAHKDFEDFFEENKKLWKKDFLKKLEEINNKLSEI